MHINQAFDSLCWLGRLAVSGICDWKRFHNWEVGHDGLRLDKIDTLH